jgi:phage terminase small subunit
MPSTTLVRRHRSSLDSLNSNELMFIRELIADDMWRPVIAARRAGYANPDVAACKLMKKPEICAALGKEQRRRLERLDLKADEVLNYLANGLFYNPLMLFKPGKDGGWIVEDLDKIPAEVGRLIESIKAKTTESLADDGTVSVSTYFELKLVSKTKLLELAMKHCGIDGSTKVEYSGGLDLNVNCGLNHLLMQIEAARRNQIVDGSVIEDISHGERDQRSDSSELP